LVSEAEGHSLRAIAEFKPVIQSASGILGIAPNNKGPIHPQFLPRWSGGHVDIRRGAFPEAQIVIALESRNTQDVEAGPERLNEFEFSQERGQFIAGLFPDQQPRLLDNLSRLGISTVLAKIAQEA